MSVLSETARAVGVHERTLRRAIRDGTLRGTWKSQRKLMIGLAERSYIRRAWPLISALRQSLRTESNVRLALLFGSAARGDDSDRSDVDVLVCLEDPSLDRVLELEAKLGSAIGRTVDLLRVEQAESHPALLAQAIDEGRILADRDDLWGALRARLPALRRRAAVTQKRRLDAAMRAIDERASISS